MGASECNKHKAKPRTRAREDRTTVSVDENIIDEFQIVVKRKLSQSEVERMVQEAEMSRDEDEANESKHEGESGLEKSEETLGEDRER